MGLISRVSSRTYREKRNSKMDARFLQQELQFFASSGHVISPEQQTQLANSLTIAKHNNHFSKILFWGKVFGIRDDYLIAQGISGHDELSERTTLYSINGNDLLLLTPDEKVREDALQIRGRFIGDPMHEYEQHEVRRFGSGVNTQDDDISIQVKEEDRLATTIAEIDQEAMIVPRGAYLRSPAGIVTRNISFSGLPKTINRFRKLVPFHRTSKITSKINFRTSRFISTNRLFGPSRR